MKDTSQPLYLATEATYIDCATIIFKQLDDAYVSAYYGCVPVIGN